MLKIIYVPFLLNHLMYVMDVIPNTAVEKPGMNIMAKMLMLTTELI